MKCVELKVTIKVPDGYDCDYPFDTLADINWNHDIEVVDVRKLREEENYKED